MLLQSWGKRLAVQMTLIGGQHVIGVPVGSRP